MARDIDLPIAQLLDVVSVGCATLVSLSCRLAFSLLMESEAGSMSLFDAFSSCEPVSTSLENAIDSGWTRHNPWLGESARIADRLKSIELAIA